MKIRTRHRLFKIIIAVAIVTFVLSLYDIFVNQSGWFIPVMAVYVVLAVAALVLYVGRKPQLEETVVAAPDEETPQDLAVETTPRSEVSVRGPHHFRCPFCSQVFALELTNLRKQHELKMDCPYCANTIRVPRSPKLVPGSLVPMEEIQPADQAVFACASCGENLRFSAPGTAPEPRVHVYTCPHCGSNQVQPAAGVAA